MPETDWRTRAGTTFRCEKQPATGTRGMVVTNHPLASAAGAEMLAAGGNAIDAAIAAFFTLTVVEPMMVGILGGGMAHIRLADGRHVVIDNQSMAPLATGPTTYTPDPNAAPGTMDAIGRKNAVGPTSVASPGNLKGWCEALARFGTFPLADVMEPAIRHASRGFRVTPYLHECVIDSAADMARDPEIAKLYLPGGAPIAAGTRLVTGDYAETLRSIAREGPDLLYTGALGATYADHMARSGGYITRDDLTRYRTIDRDALRGTYRGFDIVGTTAAVVRTAAHHPDAQHPGGLRHRRPRVWLRRHAAPAGRGAEDRLRRPGGGDRGSGLRQGAGGEAAVEVLCRDAARAHRPRAGAELERRGGARRRRAYHASHGGRRHGQHRRQHADDQLAVRRALHRAWHRHDPEQLHVRVHAASGPREFGGTRQADHLVDVAGHGAARRQAALCAGPARRVAHLPLGDAGDVQSDRSRHERAGGGRGAASLDSGLRRRGGEHRAIRRFGGVA